MRKMTTENYGRLIITLEFLAITIWTAVSKANLRFHIFFAVASIALISRVVYSYVKGR
jgi:hypothetical protein